MWGDNLDISIVSKADLPMENPRLRLDSQFQSRSALASIAAIKSVPYVSIGDLAGRSLKGRNVPYSADGQFGVIRSGDVSSAFDPDFLLRSSASSEAFFLVRGDILISSIGQGSIGRIQLFRTPGEFAAVSEVTVVRAPKLYQAFLSAFLASRFGQSQISRYITGATGQLHLYPSDVDLIFVPEVSETYCNRITGIFDREWESYSASRAAEEQIGSILLDGLGLRGWQPMNDLTYVAKASSALAAERMDAQFFRPLFGEIESRLRKTDRAAPLGNLLSTNMRGSQPRYSETGLPVINSKHVRKNRVVIHNNRWGDPSSARVVIQPGDVLLNGTGEGTIGRTAPYLHQEPALPDNHVTILRGDFDPVYLAAFLNSPLGRWQVERHTRGSSGQVELYPADISKITFWDAPAEIQAEVRRAVSVTFEQEVVARRLLGLAARSIEILIEQGELAATEFLNRAEV